MDSVLYFLSIDLDENFCSKDVEIYVSAKMDELAASDPPWPRSLVVWAKNSMKDRAQGSLLVGRFCHQSPRDDSPNRGA